MVNYTNFIDQEEIGIDQSEKITLRAKHNSINSSRKLEGYRKTSFKGPFQIVEDTGNEVFDILFSNLSENDILEKGEDFKYDKDYVLKEMFVRSSCGTDIIKWNRLQRCWINLPKEVKKKIKKEVKGKPEFLYNSNGEKTHKLNKLYNSYRII